MAAAELTMAGTGLVQAAGTKGINYYDETPGSPNKEVFRVTSDASLDFFYSRKFEKIKGFIVQNHGATFNGTSRDSPKVVVTQGTNGQAAKFTITHTATEEVFSFVIYGDL